MWRRVWRFFVCRLVALRLLDAFFLAVAFFFAGCGAVAGAGEEVSAGADWTCGAGVEGAAVWTGVAGCVFTDGAAVDVG